MITADKVLDAYVHGIDDNGNKLVTYDNAIQAMKLYGDLRAASELLKTAEDIRNRRKNIEEK